MEYVAWFGLLIYAVFERLSGGQSRCANEEALPSGGLREYLNYDSLRASDYLC